MVLVVALLDGLDLVPPCGRDVDELFVGAVVGEPRGRVVGDRDGGSVFPDRVGVELDLDDLRVFARDLGRRRVVLVDDRYAGLVDLERAAERRLDDVVGVGLVAVDLVDVEVDGQGRDREGQSVEGSSAASVGASLGPPVLPAEQPAMINALAPSIAMAPSAFALRVLM